MGLQSSLLPKNQTLWELEQHMEDALGSQYSLIKPKTTPPQTLGES